MKDSKEQSFWITYAVVMLLLLGGSGFFLFTSAGKFSDAQGGYEQLVAKKRALERGAIYPNAANVAELEQRVDSFESSVDDLHDTLRGFQRDLEVITDQQFPQLLRAAIEEFEAYALEKRVIVPEGFYFGMDQYQTSLPRPDATGILKYQLDATNYLLKTIVETGADEIIAFEREPSPVERGEADPEATQRVVKYTTEISFRTTHDGFQRFLNEVSNDEEYFFIVRVLRVDNEVKTGPSKDVLRPTIYRDPETNEVVVEAEDLGIRDLVVEDASVIFGMEKLMVTAVIDLCRFPEIRS